MDYPSRRRGIRASTLSCVGSNGLWQEVAACATSSGSFSLFWRKEEEGRGRPADAMTSRYSLCSGLRPRGQPMPSTTSQSSLWQTRRPVPQSSRIRTPVSCIRKAVAWARSANQPVYVLCTEYSPFPCSHGVTTLKQTQDPCVDPSGARCQDPKPSNNTDPSRLVNKYLDSVADHKARHRPTSNLPFHPIVFSLGGMMNGSTTKVFASWKRVMTRGTYNLMLKWLSLCLLQARVRSFEL
jgi:hypothetical protein